MTLEIDLEGAAEMLRETIEEECRTVDQARLEEFIEETSPEELESLLDASDPGGLIDDLDDMDPDLLDR